MNRTSLGVLYVSSIPVLAAIGPVTGIQIGGFNYTGLLWVFTLGAGGTLILAQKAVHRTSQICFPFAPWLLWVGFVWCSLLWCKGVGLGNVQSAAQITMPVVVGVTASLVIRSPSQLDSLLKMFIPVLVILYLILAAAYSGLIGIDPTMDKVVLSEPAMAHTVVMAGCVLITLTPPRFVAAFWGWAACIILTVLAGSRMPSLALLLIPVFYAQHRSWQRKALVVAAVACVALALFYTPAVQQRFFYSGSGTLSDVFQGEFRTTGRFETWPLILKEAWRYPVLGQGVGTCTEFVPTVWPRMTHPHNDYLRVGFELGLVGLVLLLGILAWLFVDLRRRMMHTEGTVRRAFAASWLGLCAFFIMAATGNTLTYNLWFMNPWFVVMGAAYGVAASGGNREDGSSRNGSQVRSIHGGDAFGHE